jgi:hypothetical protein
MSRVVTLLLLPLLLGATAAAHPGSGIAMDERGHVFFTDTGKGIWRATPEGSLELVSTSALHWLAAAPAGAALPPPGEHVEYVRPRESDLVLALCSDYPIAAAADGSLVLAITRSPTHLARRVAGRPDEIIAPVASPTDAASAPTFRHITGVAIGPDRAIVVLDLDPASNDHALHVVSSNGRIRTLARNFIDVDGTRTKAVAGNICRGVARAPSGDIYVAATGARAVVRLDAKGASHPVLGAEAPWSPTAVTTHDGDLYVLEYTDTPPGADGSDRTVWVPRVRKVATDGHVRIVAVVRR